MRNYLPRSRCLGAILLATGVLAACGGGAGGDGDDNMSSYWSTNPAGATSFSGAAAAYQGSISGLGSIVVNGVRFETTDAVVYDSDDFSAAYDSSVSTFSSPLALGMTVALFGDVDDTQSLGRAARIRVVGGVRGNMTSINSTSITLATQTITLDSATTYGGISAAGTLISTHAQLAALTGNPLLTIYGIPQTNGDFLATRVVVTTSSTYPIAVRGALSAINGTNYSVTVNANTTITVNCATCAIQPMGTTPVVGDSVRVLATHANQWNNASATLTAARLQLVNASYLTTFTGSPTSASYAKIKGVATLNNGAWYVGGVQVSNVDSLLAAGVASNSNTIFEVKGTLTGAVLAASAVEIEGQRSFVTSNNASHSYRNELYGAVSNLNLGNNTFTVQGVTVNASSAYFPNGSIANLSNGSFVEVKGSYVDSTLSASKVEIKYASSSNASTGRVFEMYGQVSGWTGISNTFYLSRFGTTYVAQTSANTRFKYGAPSNSSFVEVKGYMDANNVFQVIKLELKSGYHDDDD